MIIWTHDDGDDAQDVPEWHAVLCVVDQGNLNFLGFVDCLRYLIRDRPVDDWRIFWQATWCLEKAAISAKDLMKRVPCQLAKGIRCIDNRSVRSLKVTKSQGDRAVDGT